jgi:outer membrane PBP1 activator LpoA protein
LPLSGAQKALAEAVRDGFVAAYLADRASGQRPEIMVFDEESPGAQEAYRAAIAAGANVIVGPLLRESVAAVAAMAGPARTLALNYAEGVTAPAAGFYQFALSPEDEARQAAIRAVADGRGRALAFAPDTDWGRRMIAAFEPALLERGGRLLDYRLYDPGQTDFTADIQRLLQLDQSRARQRQLAANLGVSLEFEPRRRGDAECIFLAASTASGRLIRPQLRFLYAADLPVYATSAIYQAGSSGDGELDGVMFTDAPIVLGNDERAAQLRTTLTARWGPGSLARLRFYGMGFDAYDLFRVLAAGALAPIPGLSGLLSADPQGRIHRQMPWAEFRNGRITILTESLPPAATSTAQPL